MALDQYTDNILAEVWDLNIGDSKKRMDIYRKFITKLFKDNGCHHVLDAACGTGIDSIMLLEEGFQVTSIDLSYKMKAFAQDSRWKRRKEPAFDSWVIKSGNWLTLKDDLEDDGPFDAVICLGNSFSVLLDSSPQRSLQMKALNNMAALIKPGGILIIDHANFEDNLHETGNKFDTIYYSGHGINVTKSAVFYENGQPSCIERHCKIDINSLPRDVAEKYKKYDDMGWIIKMFPIQMKKFQQLLQEVFGPSATYETLGDYKPLDQVKNPSTYIHIVKKSS